MTHEAEPKEQTFIVTLEHPLDADCAFANPDHQRHTKTIPLRGISEKDVVDAYNDPDFQKEPCVCDAFYVAVSAKAVS
jgi:hypothetical protein